MFAGFDNFDHVDTVFVPDRGSVSDSARRFSRESKF